MSTMQSSITSSPLSALSGESGGGNMATLLDPIGAAGNAVFGDSPIKYLLMPHLLLTEGLLGGSSGSGSSSGIATLLGGSDASTSA